MKLSSEFLNHWNNWSKSSDIMAKNITHEIFLHINDYKSNMTKILWERKMYGLA
jgi:hypothetical protein